MATIVYKNHDYEIIQLRDKNKTWMAYRDQDPYFCFVDNNCSIIQSHAKDAIDFYCKFLNKYGK